LPGGIRESAAEESATQVRGSGPILNCEYRPPEPRGAWALQLPISLRPGPVQVGSLRETLSASADSRRRLAEGIKGTHRVGSSHYPTAGLANFLGADGRLVPSSQGRPSHGANRARPESRPRASKHRSGRPDPPHWVEQELAEQARETVVSGPYGGNGAHKSGFMTRFRTGGARARLMATDSTLDPNPPDHSWHKVLSNSWRH
jgi:hypothetical protein